MACTLYAIYVTDNHDSVTKIVSDQAGLSNIKYYLVDLHNCSDFKEQPEASIIKRIYAFCER